MTDNKTPSAEEKILEEKIRGKNKHSVYLKCPKCKKFGIGMPFDRECGNCKYSDCILYIDIETVLELLSSLK